MISKLTLLAVLLVSVYAGVTDTDPEVKTSKEKEVWTRKTLLQTRYSDKEEFAVLRAVFKSPAQDVSIDPRFLDSIQIASGLVSEQNKPFRYNVVAVLKLDEMGKVADFILGSEQEVEIKHDDRTVRLSRDPEFGVVSFDIEDPSISWGQTKGTRSGSLAAELAEEVAHDLENMVGLFQVVPTLQKDPKEQYRFANALESGLYTRRIKYARNYADKELMMKAIGYTGNLHHDSNKHISDWGIKVVHDRNAYPSQVEFLCKVFHSDPQKDDHHDQE